MLVPVSELNDWFEGTLDIEILAKRNSLHKSFVEINTYYLSTLNKVNKFSTLLNERNKPLVNKINELEQELKLLKEQLEEKNLEAYEQFIKSRVSDKVWNDTIEETRAHNSKLQQEQEQEKRIPKEMKKLFKQIAQVAHTDKSNNKMLNDLFLQAKACLKKKDWSRLKRIAVCVKKRMSLRSLQVQEEIDELEEQLKILGESTLQLHKSEELSMLRDYETNIPQLQHRVHEYYTNKLLRKEQELKDIIRNLDPSRYPVANFTYTFYITATNW